MIAASYVMDLYCDVEDCTYGRYGTLPGASQFVGESKAHCLRQAKRSGWRVAKDLTYCECSAHQKARRADPRL